MNEKFKNALWLLLYSFMAGLSLSLFTQIQDIFKYLFSLLAIYIGIRFFRRFESIWMRVAFIAVAIVFYFAAALAFAIYFYIKENPQVVTG